MSVAPKNSGTETTLARFRWPIAAVVIVLLLVVGMVAAVRSCAKAPSQTINSLGNAVSQIVGKFDQQNITRTFEESLPTLSSEPGGRLELAAMTMTETLSESNNLTTGWGKLNLGSTVTEIKVPANFRYYLRLHDPWKLDVTTNICIVHAPRFHPTLPPAIDTSRMEKKSSAGWGRFNATEQMDQLEKDITPTLAQFAGDERHLALVREECRKTVAQFVRDWLLKEQQWRDDRFTSIKVVFPDEGGTNITLMFPTLELKGR